MADARTLLEINARLKQRITELEAQLAQAQSPSVPTGLCGNRLPHEPHLVEYAAVAGGPMNCHADQSKRVPGALEQR